MRRRIVVVLAVALLVLSAVAASAYERKSKTYPWMASFDRTGQLNLYAAVGFYYYGIDVAGGPEVILGNFDVSGIPLEWGIAGKAMLGFANFAGLSWMDWGVAPLVTLHWGIDAGGPLKFIWYVGLGLGISGSTANYGYYNYGSGIGFGFATADGLAWVVSNNIAIIADYTYFGYNSMFGIGVKLNI